MNAPDRSVTLYLLFWKFRRLLQGAQSGSPGQISCREVNMPVPVYPFSQVVLRQVRCEEFATCQVPCETCISPQ